jgi:hypothetical protein
LGLAFAAMLPVTAGAQQKKVVVYTSNESTLNDLVFGAFTKETGIAVEPVVAGSGVVIRRLQAEKGPAARRHRLGHQPLAAADQQGAVRALCLEEQGRDAGRVSRPDRSLGRQQPPPAGDPAEHKILPADQDRRAGTTCSIRSGRARSPSPIRPTRARLYDRHHAGRPVGRRRGPAGKRSASCSRT